MQRFLLTLLGLVSALTLVVGGTALADGPSGSTEEGNEVDCNEDSSTDVGGVFYVYAAENGVETCGDDTSSLPLDGRVIVTSDQGGYIAADGDASNSAPLDGYVRVDASGVHCGDENNQDSTASDQSGNTVEDCDTSSS